MTVQPIDGWRFFVKGGKMDCVVDLEHGKCDCGVYAVEKIPCSHAIAAGTSAGLHISTLLRNAHAFLGMKSVVREDRRNQDGNLGWSYPG
ncbi:hypothetical protein DY000_02033825 [Brassica cretica]|uniref:SWIM-type domain-containing protein n=1 Tax=Brassica cretica TaxID=69181 RepID=A0ABQ7DIU0_BRACR|nr:hypothetical protein DY000_02033825 [Brassica cretica]